MNKKFFCIKVIIIALFWVFIFSLAGGASAALTCGTTGMASRPLPGAGLNFFQVSNTLSNSATNTLTFQVQNFGEAKTVSFLKAYCRCKEHLGYPYRTGLGQCQYYWDPESTDTNKSCQFINEEIHFNAGEIKTITVSATQFNNQLCGSFQLDFFVDKINGINYESTLEDKIFGASFTDVCQDCVSTPCVSHANKKCIGNAIYWFDFCGNQEELVQTCSSNEICQNAQCLTVVCSANSQCGTNGFVGDPFCQSGNVFQNYKTFTCNNPGAANSVCSDSTAPQLKTTCLSNQTCSNGTCNQQNNLSVFCYASPNSVNINQQVSFVATATGGSGSYFYYWSGACAGSSQSCYNSFSQSGTQTAVINITSGGQNSSATCSVNINQNNNCAQNYQQRCAGNAVYWYDSCGNQGNYIQTCSYNQTCSNGSCSNNCAYHHSKRCVNNNLYWYDSCQNQQDIAQYCQNGCQNNFCQNQTGGLVTVSKTVRNLSSGNLNWSSSISASPSDVLMFMITITTAGNQNISNITVRDVFPANLIYKNQLAVSGANYTGDINSIISLGTISANQTVTITYQAQVASAQHFNYGTTTLNNNVSVNSSNSGSNPLSNVSIVVVRTTTQGATSISTGLTNNFLADSFFLPTLIALIGLWIFKSDIFGFEKWIDIRKKKHHEYKSQKQLSAKINQIKQTEKNYQ